MFWNNRRSSTSSSQFVRIVVSALKFGASRMVLVRAKFASFPVTTKKEKIEGKPIGPLTQHEAHNLLECL